MVLQSVTPMVSRLRSAPSESRPTLSFEDGASRHNRLRFAPHTHLFIQGDTPKGIYEVLSGTVIQYKILADGRRHVQNFASKGDFLALTFADTHDLSAEALTAVEVQFVPRSVFDSRLQEQPAFRRAVFTLVSDMLHDSREQALLLGRKCAKERTATFVLFLNETYRDLQTGYASIPMSRCDMADYLGLTLETVSRMMNSLKKAGVIDLPQPNLFKVLNMSKLVSLAGEIYEDESMVA